MLHDPGMRSSSRQGRPHALHPSRPAAAIACVSTLLLAACGGDTTAPKQPHAPLAIVDGANITDTIQARPIQALVVEVHDADGAPARGVVVRFEAQQASDSLHRGYWSMWVAPLTANSFSNFTTDVTDSSGRAKALTQFGIAAGPAAIVVKVPELGLEDTATYTAMPGNAARLAIQVRDTAMYAAGQYTIGAASTDRWANPRPGDAITYTAASGNVSVSGAGVVTGTSEGRAAIAVKTGTVVDTAYVSVVPHGTIVYVQASPHGVAVVNLDGTGHKFLHAVSDWSIFPQWSFDGKSIIMYEGDPGSNARLTLTGLDSTSRTVLQIPHDSLVGMAWPRFAPDGSIFFGGVTSGVGQIVWHVQADGSGLAEIAGSHGNYSYQHPVVSPDGRTLLFDNAQSTNGLMTLDLATGATTSIGSGTWPTYSPDGSRIAYVSNYTVMVADANGANARAITTPGIQDNTAPSWSADGQWVFVPGSPSRLVRVSDGNTMPLPFTAAGFAQPSLR